MATAVLELELAQLSREILVAPQYRRALVLLRHRGRVLTSVAAAVHDGRIYGPALRDVALHAASGTLLDVALRNHLGVGAAPPAAVSATVAVCTRDRPQDLERCLTALRRLPDDGQEIVVVDSASRGKETARVCAAHGVRCVRVELPGLDRARNRALREARGDVVAFCDDDAAPDAGWLRALLRHFGDARVLAVTGLTMPLELETEAQEWFERTNAFSRGFTMRRFDGTVDNPLLVARMGAGANMALRRDVLQSVGPFDPALDAGTPTRSGGDHDMFARILAAGYSVVYEPDALSWHRHRREWHELRQTIYGYGVGVYAHLTRQALRRESAVLGVSLGWFRSQLRELIRALLRRRNHIPLDLALAELAGCAVGPLAYLRSRLRVAREGTGA
jgi:cellulose synthase/poly-beta-1,6-N-acetylglucosamine synthase-like glycosyltransferase